MRTPGEVVRAWRENVMKESAASLGRRVGASRQNIENFEKNDTRRPRFLPELAAAMGYSVQELLAAKDPPALRRGELSMAHRVSLPGPRVERKQPTWEQLVAGDGFEELFETALPDDANSPEFARGLMIIWSTTKSPEFGSLILVRDRHGQLHARTYTQGKLPGHWLAAASNRAYATFDSQEDGLKIEAVAAYRGI